MYPLKNSEITARNPQQSKMTPPVLHSYKIGRFDVVWGDQNDAEVRDTNQAVLHRGTISDCLAWARRK